MCFGSACKNYPTYRFLRLQNLSNIQVVHGFAKIYPTHAFFMRLQNLFGLCVFYALTKSIQHMCFLMRLQNLSNIWVFMHLQNVSNICFFFMWLQNLSNRCVFSALAKSAVWVERCRSTPMFEENDAFLPKCRGERHRPKNLTAKDWHEMAPRWLQVGPRWA